MKMTTKTFSGFGSIETWMSKMGPIFSNKVHKNYSNQNLSIVKVVLQFLHSSMKKKNPKNVVNF